MISSIDIYVHSIKKREKGEKVDFSKFTINSDDEEKWDNLKYIGLRETITFLVSLCYKKDIKEKFLEFCMDVYTIRRDIYFSKDTKYTTIREDFIDIFNTVFNIFHYIEKEEKCEDDFSGLDTGVYIKLSL